MTGYRFGAYRLAPTTRGNTVGREVGQQTRPAVRSVAGVVTRAIVGVETVAGVRVDDDLVSGLAGLGHGVPHGRDRAAQRVLPAVQAKHRRVQLGHEVDGVEPGRIDRLPGDGRKLAVP